MSENPKSKSVPPVTTPRKRRRWPWVVAGIFLLFLLFIVLLPAILSTGMGKAIILSQVNKRINGHVEISDWSLGWFSGFHFDGIKVAGADGATVAEVKSVTVPTSAFALLGKNKKLGDVTIESPQVNVVLYPDGTNNLMAILNNTQPKVRAEQPPENKSIPSTRNEQANELPANVSTVQTNEKNLAPLGTDIQTQLVVTDGEITVVTTQSAQPMLIRNLSMTASVASLNKSIPFEIKANLGEEEATLQVTGSATVAQAGIVAPHALEANATVQLAGLQLASVSGLTRHFGSPVDMGGELDATVTAIISGTESLKTNGSVDVTSLALSGGPLGADKPKFDETNLSFDVALNGKKVEVSEFNIHSPVLDATAAGTLNIPEPGHLPSGNIVSTTTVHIAPLAAQLPNTLRLHEGLIIESGTLTLASNVTTDTAGPAVKSTIRLEEVEASRDGQRISLEQPVSVDLQARQTDKGLWLDKFELASSFAQAHGSGNTDQFDLNMTTDLAAATKDAAKFVDMGNFSAQGTATLVAHLGTATDQRKTIAASGSVKDLSVEGIGPQPAILKELLFTAQAVAERDAQNTQQRFTGLLATLSSPLAEAKFAAETVTPLTAGALPVAMTNGRATIKANLANLSEFAHGIGAIPPTMDARGALEVTVGVTAENDAVRVEGLDIMLKDMLLMHDGKKIRDPEVHIVGKKIEANPANRALALSDFVVNISAGTMEIPHATVPDWAKKDATGIPSGMNAVISGNFDVAKSLETFKEFFQLPEGSNATGTAQLVINTTAAEDVVTTSLRGSMDNFRLTQPGKPDIEDNHPTFDVVTVFNPQNDSLNFDSIKVASTFLNLTAKGNLSDLSNSKRLFAEGSLEPDFDQIGPLAAAIMDQPIELSGKQSRPFKIDTTLNDTDWRIIVRDTLADAGIFIARVKFMGIETGDIDLPLNMDDGKAQCKIDTTVNGGKLFLPATLDMTGDVPLLTVPDNTPLLTDARIPDEMADLFLAKFIPLFKGAIITNGTVGLNVAKLAAPLDTDVAKNTTFAGDFVFKGIKMRPSGFLLEIVEYARLSPNLGLDIPDQEIGISLRDERFYQDPITIMAGKFPLRISGSVGLDNTLDILAEIPVTPELLGKYKDLYALLKNESIKIPIKGTTDDPDIGADIFQTNLTSLIKSAGTKEIQDKGLELLEKGLNDLLGGGRKK